MNLYFGTIPYYILGCSILQKYRETVLRERVIQTMPQPYADADLSELLAAKVTVLSAAERIHPDSNAFTQSFNREKTLSDDFRRYQSQAIKYYLEKRYDATNIRLNVQFDRTTVVATFLKGW